MTDADEILTVEEAAALLKLPADGGPAIVARLIASGAIRGNGVRRGSRGPKEWRTTRSACLDWINRPAAPPPGARLPRLVARKG